MSAYGDYRYGPPVVVETECETCEFVGRYEISQHEISKIADCQGPGCPEFVFPSRSHEIVEIDWQPVDEEE